MRHLPTPAALLLAVSCTSTSTFTGPVGIDPERRGFVDAVRIQEDRFVPFWGETIVGVSSIPLVCWGLAALWIALSPPKRRRLDA